MAITIWYYGTTKKKDNEKGNINEENEMNENKTDTNSENNYVKLSMVPSLNNKSAISSNINSHNLMKKCQIFISIPSYRDPELPFTLINLFGSSLKNGSDETFESSEGFQGEGKAIMPL